MSYTVNIDPKTTIVVARKGLVGEAFSALLVTLAAGGITRHLVTPPQTDPAVLASQIAATFGSLDTQGQSTLLLLGGYYLDTKTADSLKALAGPFSRVICLCKPDDASLHGKTAASASVDLISEPMCGWVTNAISGLPPHNYAVALEISPSLDAMDYNYPSEDDKNLHYGIPSIEGSDDIIKITKILDCTETLDGVRAKGIARRASNAFVCQRRVNEAAQVTLSLPQSAFASVPDNASAIDALVPVNFLIGSGDTLPAETADLLAENSPSGIGMVVRHTPSTGKTFITVCASARSNINAARATAHLTKVAGGGGGGSAYLGGGSMPAGFLPWIEAHRVAAGW
ncbi:hypothetical protein psal_cds_1349 [Pandoravirus salinus]|uniref:Uncharacterized protein n=1 Tax=Pandoravirus salinus TaxID=1349410 RepID=S4W4T5_9VIRU|nr:hypothetical protein psal_cds_1349 [Pandoravirus salinus]AGO85742.1 hypothetical protein psal_cds_1349 [Pandoravirus salinus]